MLKFLMIILMPKFSTAYLPIPAKKEEIMEAIKKNTPKIRYEIGKRIRLRLTPELNFILDESLERGSRITDLIDKISKGEI